MNGDTERLHRRQLLLSAAWMAMGRMTSDELRDVADAALCAGVYSPALADLATKKHPIMSEVGPLFRRALEELGLRLPSPERAVRLLLWTTITDIAEGHITARTGVEIVSSLAYQDPWPDWAYDLRQLVQDDYGYEDSPDDWAAATREKYDVNVLAHAKQWLEAHPEWSGWD